jgi:hypothetical protein
MTRVRTLARRLRTLHGDSGQSLIEFAMVTPLFLTLVLGVVEVSYALLDQHIVTKMSREGANLISRDVPLHNAALALKSMSSGPVDFTSHSKVIFSVLKRGATTGTSNFDKIILYQRYEYGSGPGTSQLNTAGSGSFGTGPNYEAANSDNNTNLRVTNVPSNLVSVQGGLIYVAEIYSQHDLITPLDNLGIQVPETLYSIAYF